MTYCVAMSLDAGMIFASDSRTNAGVDQIARFSKMRVFAQDGDRVIVTLSSGNLSITQNALNTLEQRARAGDNELNLWNAESMFDVARLLGDALREVKSARRPVPGAEQHRLAAQLPRRRPDPRRAAAAVQRLQRGQLHRGDARHLLFPDRRDQVRQAGDRPRDQAQHDASLDATKCTIVSFDSTMRSNISVGLPIDLLVYEADALRIKMQRRIEETDPYFQMVHAQWGEGLRRVFAQLPDPDWT